jgi:hypothetical protein
VISDMFTPEEWAAVWNWRTVNDPTDDALGKLIREEKLRPYCEVLVPLVEEGRIGPLMFVYAMTTLAMIEEIEAAREMRKLSS